jgi:hypothetical protein
MHLAVFTPSDNTILGFSDGEWQSSLIVFYVY